MSTYVIGDLHGCHAEFVDLLEALSFDPRRDCAWLVGDLVNRGPDSLACLREVRALGDAARCVLGNHDLHFLVAARGGRIKPRSAFASIVNAADGGALLDWLQSRPLTVRRERTLMVHAGLLPEWGLDQAQSLAAEVEAALAGEQAGDFLARLFGDQPDRWRDDLEGMDRLRFIVNVMTRMRFISPGGRLEFTAKRGLASAPEGFKPWFRFPREDDATLLFGHWAALEGQTPGARVDARALDTGCAWGGSLTALELETGQRTRVPSRQPQEA
ncbi:symmetrical bis(5'-nucleosyl)-tetraphosphatase [Halomonas piscis]|uniref:bis(5'-nucleosyl)-tetraphosphatase (symmetrical) n=1 Tax=Halomonas piscis TaxID=3031727 RepID=A0ABY9Z1J7_9GAMM|nr:symmetrical bis(5'-nucleosyl)-tetraphosphatase [Halomonas piscis]WNK20902.1 symmetrical bis(5'-nucleosyl)-tetraphosphatase [Halomonas piscis]